MNGHFFWASAEEVHLQSGLHLHSGAHLQSLLLQVTSEGRRVGCVSTGNVVEKGQTSDLLSVCCVTKMFVFRNTCVAWV